MVWRGGMGCIGGWSGRPGQRGACGAQDAAADGDGVVPGASGDGARLAGRGSDRAAKQRHTARRVWQRLLAEQGAVVAESTVRAFVAEVRRELSTGTGLAMVPQTHPPAEEALCGIPA